MVVTNVFETGHLVEVNHRDWPPECRQMVDPISNRLAPEGSHEDDYYAFEQVDTYLTAPPKPPHPDAAKYLWPGQTAEEDDEEADSDLLILMGTLKAKVVSDRPAGVKEFYDCLVCAEEGEAEEARWSAMSTWLRQQNKLVEVDERIDEVRQRGQPTPALSSAQAKRLQEKLHRSREWMIMERWQQNGMDPAVIVRSHHKDVGDEDWKRREVVDQLLEDSGYIARHGGTEVLMLDQMGGSSASKSAADSSSSDSDDEDDSDDMDESNIGFAGDSDDSADGMMSLLFGANRQAIRARRAQARKAKKPKMQKGHKALPDYLTTDPKLRPLRTYTITMNVFLNLSAQRSAPQTTALSLTPLNCLMAQLFPQSAKLQAMVAEAEGEVPAPLRDSMRLDVLMSLSVRDEEGKPMYYETFKKREAARIQAEHDAKEEAEKKRAEEEAAKKQAAKKGGRKGKGRTSSNAAEAVEEKKEAAVGADDEKDEVQEEPFMDIGVGEAEEELSVKCGLTITLRDYQCTTVKWMLEQEDAESNTNMYLWSQLQFPAESLKQSGQRRSSSIAAASSSSSAAARNMTEPPLFYYSPLMQRFRFKPLPELRGGWNVEEMGLGQSEHAHNFSWRQSDDKSTY